MESGWRAENRRLTTLFDRVADLYRSQFADELDRKPFDRSFLSGVAQRLRKSDPAPVLEVGAGPAHVAAFLAERGVPMVASDLSTGQLREARALAPSRPLLAADLARLPIGRGRLAAVVAFYCLIYGAATHLDAVFEDWAEALRPDGLVVVAVHAGEGRIDTRDWLGRAVDLTVVLRDPADLCARMTASGFAVEQCTLRAPYHDEHPTERLYVLARRTGGGESDG